MYLIVGLLSLRGCLISGVWFVLLLELWAYAIIQSVSEAPGICDYFCFFLCILSQTDATLQSKSWKSLPLSLFLECSGLASGLNWNGEKLPRGRDHTIYDKNK